MRAWPAPTRRARWARLPVPGRHGRTVRGERRADRWLLRDRRPGPGTRRWSWRRPSSSRERGHHRGQAGRRRLTDLEDAWREEWGRLLALLVAQFRRLDLAEDGLGDAFATAAEHGGATAPDNPAAWLLTAARRRIYDRLRSEAIARHKLPLLQVDAALTEEARTMADAGEAVVDERLRLVLLCAHPSLAPENAAALTLRLVLGVSTADIAQLFLVPTPTMAARLTRARKALADEPFEAPSGESSRSGSRRWPTSPTSRSRRATRPGRAQLLRAEQAGEAIRLVRVLRRCCRGFAERRRRRAARADADPALAPRRSAAGRPAGAAAGPGQGAVAARRDRRGARAPHPAGAPPPRRTSSRR